MAIYIVMHKYLKLIYVMMSEEIVGNGAHWNVYRITENHNGQKKCWIRKRSINGKVDSNIIINKIK